MNWYDPLSLDLLEAEEVSLGERWERPAYVDRMSAGARAEYNAFINGLYNQGKSVDDVNRQMHSYDPSYFEGLAASRRPPSPQKMPRILAPAPYLAAKSCGADGDFQAWLLLSLCLLVLYLTWLGVSRMLRPAEPSP